MQAGQWRVDRTTSQEATHHIGDVELAHQTTRKEIATAAQAFKAPCKKQHSRGVSIKTVNEAQIRLQGLQTRDHRVLLMNTSSWLTQ